MCIQIPPEKLFFILPVGLILACILIGIYFIQRRSRTATTTTPPPSLTPLQELNKEFRRQYIKARDQFCRSATENGSVIIGNGSSLTLVHKGIRYSVSKAIPQVYHDLKSVSHIPLTIYIFLTNQSSTLSLDTLEEYWKHLSHLQIPDSINTNEEISLQRIISASQKLLEKELNNRGSVDRDELKEFCRDLTNDLVVLLNAAAIAQLNSMHKIVLDWINEHNIDPKSSSLKVLLIGARTARQKNLQSTYFERLLGNKGKVNISYIEELFDNESKAISIFSTWFFDEELSMTFFDDQDRMHYDLLMNDHIEEYIEQLIG